MPLNTMLSRLMINHNRFFTVKKWVLIKAHICNQFKTVGGNIARICHYFLKRRKKILSILKLVNLVPKAARMRSNISQPYLTAGKISLYPEINYITVNY